MLNTVAWVTALVHCATLARGSAVDLPVPADGLYKRRFIIPFSELRITITDSETDTPKASILGKMPMQADIINAVDIPYTASPGPFEGTSTLTLDPERLAPFLPSTNGFISARGYAGKLTPEAGIKVVYFPMGRNGDGDPSLFVTVQTDTEPTVTDIWKGHCIFGEDE